MTSYIDKIKLKPFLFKMVLTETLRERVARVLSYFFLEFFPSFTSICNPKHIISHNSKQCIKFSNSSICFSMAETINLGGRGYKYYSIKICNNSIINTIKLQVHKVLTIEFLHKTQNHNN